MQPPEVFLDISQNSQVLLFNSTPLGDCFCNDTVLTSNFPYKFKVADEMFARAMLLCKNVNVNLVLLVPCWISRVLGT